MFCRLLWNSGFLIETKSNILLLSLPFRVCSTDFGLTLYSLVTSVKFFLLLPFKQIHLPRHWASYFCCRYFSYEHFYVIYCKFWELDTDHDFLIDKENLIRYGNHALTYRIVDRIFSQVGVFLVLCSSLINLPCLL